jgi:hypothetical protein
MTGSFAPYSNRAQTLDRAKMKARIAKVTADALKIAAMEDAKALNKVLTTAKKSAIHTGLHATAAFGSGAVAMGAAAMKKPLIAIPAGIAALGKTKATILTGKIAKVRPCNQAC